jgi:hypothetical protein
MLRFRLTAGRDLRPVGSANLTLLQHREIKLIAHCLVWQLDGELERGALAIRERFGS